MPAKDKQTNGHLSTRGCQPGKYQPCFWKATLSTAARPVALVQCGSGVMGRRSYLEEPEKGACSQS